MNTNASLYNATVSCRRNVQPLHPSAFVNIYVKIPGLQKHKPLLALDAISVDRTLLTRDFHDIAGSALFKVKLPGNSKPTTVRSTELEHLALRVFDSEGKVLDQVIHDEHEKGTGCWGPELNTGKLVYIYSSSIAKEYQGHNVDLYTQGLRALLRSHYVQVGDTVIVLPSSPDEEMCYRKFGFRRIGRSVWLGYSVDSNHASRLLSLEDDVPSDNAEYRSKDAKDWITAIMITCSLGASGVSRTSADIKYPEAYPLHHTMYGGGTDWWHGSPLFSVVHTTWLTMVLPPLELLKHTIRAIFDEDPALIRTTDREGYTPLHIAAAYFNLPAVNCLLDVAAPADPDGSDENRSTAPGAIYVLGDLDRRDNVLYKTPLELCEAQLRLDRERTARKLTVRMDNLAGYALGDVDGIRRKMGTYEDGLRTAYTLRRVMNLDVGGAQDEAEYVALNMA